MSEVDTSAEAVERRATRIERYAKQRRSEAGNWARGSSLHTEVLAHAETIAGDAATLRALLAERDRLSEENARLRKALANYACDAECDECDGYHDAMWCGQKARVALTGGADNG